RATELSSDLQVIKRHFVGVAAIETSQPAQEAGCIRDARHVLSIDVEGQHLVMSANFDLVRSGATPDDGRPGPTNNRILSAAFVLDHLIAGIISGTNQESIILQITLVPGFLAVDHQTESRSGRDAIHVARCHTHGSVLRFVIPIWTVHHYVAALV